MDLKPINLFGEYRRWSYLTELFGALLLPRETGILWRMHCAPAVEKCFHIPVVAVAEVDPVLRYFQIELKTMIWELDLPYY